jgi:DNA repair protein RadC
MEVKEGGRKGHTPILYNHWMGKEQYQQHSFLAASDMSEARQEHVRTGYVRRRQLTQDKRLREAIAPYMDIPKLR